MDELAGDLRPPHTNAETAIVPWCDQIESRNMAATLTDDLLDCQEIVKLIQGDAARWHRCDVTLMLNDSKFIMLKHSCGTSST